MGGLRSGWRLVFVCALAWGSACGDDAATTRVDGDGAGDTGAVDVSDDDAPSDADGALGGCGRSACDIDGACVDAGAAHPTDPCRVCDPATARAAWSDAVDGAPCDDGDACTLVSACEAGRCVGDPEPECTDAPPCADGVTCDDEGCAYIVSEGFCLVDGACTPDGEAPAGAPCLRCDAAADPREHRALDGATCDDGDGCTLKGTCDAGECVTEPRACDDGLSCTDDRCVDGECLSDLRDGACLIDGACHEGGGRRDGAPCLACRPELATRAWSLRDDGAACDDGDTCTEGGVCELGVCVTELFSLDAEPNDAREDSVVLSGEAIGESFPAGSDSATMNPWAERDWFTWPLDFDEPGLRVKVGLLSWAWDDFIEVCVLVTCGFFAETAPEVVCLGTPMSDGAATGCCEGLNPGDDLLVTPDCGDSERGRAFVRFRSGGPAGAVCPVYTFQWGGVVR